MAKNKTDLIKVDTTYYSLQMSGCIDAKDLCALVPASLPRTQSEIGLARVNEMSTSKQLVQPVLDIRSDGLFHFSERLIQTALRKSFHIIVSLSFPGKEHLLCSGIFCF